MQHKMFMACIYTYALYVLYTYSVGYGVACSDEKAIPEP